MFIFNNRLFHYDPISLSKEFGSLGLIRVALRFYDLTIFPKSTTQSGRERNRRDYQLHDVFFFFKLFELIYFPKASKPWYHTGHEHCIFVPATWWNGRHVNLLLPKEHFKRVNSKLEEEKKQQKTQKTVISRVVTKKKKCKNEKTTSTLLE